MEKHWHSASNNGLGGVAHADNWAYVMESVEHFLNGFSDSEDSDDEVSPLSTQSGSALSQSDVTESVVRFLNGLIDADDSDDEVPHLSTQNGSPLSQSEYESAVEDFEALENQWLNEPDCLQQKTLYKSVFEAEVAFALKFKIYSHLITGNQQEVSIAKEKTRNRMRTRFKNKCCISVPVQGRAMRGEKTKKKVRFRIDPETQQIVSWLSFQQRHNTQCLMIWLV